MKSIFYILNLYKFNEMSISLCIILFGFLTYFLKYCFGHFEAMFRLF